METCASHTNREDPWSSWPERRIGYLGLGEFRDGETIGFRQGMYGTLAEVLEMFQASTARKRTVHFIRTVESSTVEEFVVFEKTGVRKNLLFRAWPILYSSDRRLEVQFFDRDPELRDKALTFLSLWTRTHGAELVRR